MFRCRIKVVRLIAREYIKLRKPINERIMTKVCKCWIKDVNCRIECEEVYHVVQGVE